MIKHKYRAWNVEEKIMHDVAFPSWNGVMEVWQDNKPQSKIQYLSMAGTEEEGVLEQYIGLKDCKRTKEYPEGQEIYEGDIIRFTFECDIETHILTGLVEYNNDGYFQVVSKCLYLMNSTG